MKSFLFVCCVIASVFFNPNFSYAQQDIVPGFLLQASYGLNGGVIRSSGIAYTKSGNLYATGEFSNTADFDPGPDTFQLKGSGNYVAKYNSVGKLQWAFSLRSAAILSVATDKNENVYITGRLLGLTDFDPGSGTTTLSPIYIDIFYAKYTPGGKLIFAKVLPGRVTQEANAIAVDDSMNIYLAGYYQGDSTDFDPGPGKVILPNESKFYDTNIFFAKYDANGNYVYAKPITGSKDDAATGIALDKNRNILLTGTFNSHTTDFDPGPGVQSVVYHGNNDAFVAKYDNQGNYLFAFSIGGVSSENGSGITTDSAGNIFVTGLFYLSVDFDPLPGTTHTATKTSNGETDIFLAKYSPNGAYQFVSTIGGNGIDAGYKIKTDETGNVYIAGTFSGKAVDFNPGSGIDTLSATATGTDIFFAKYTNTGNYVYAKKVGGASAETPSDMLVVQGNVILTGIFNNNVDVDPGNGSKTYFSKLDNSFIAAYNANGSLNKSFDFDNYRGFRLETYINRITHDKQRNIYITGQFEGIIDLDPGPGTYYLTSASDASITDNSDKFGDIFFAKYSPNGKLIFAKNISGPHGEAPTAIALDKDNNIYLTGEAEDSTDFNPEKDTFLLRPTGNNESLDFFAKYDANGNFVFAKALQLSDAYNHSIQGIAVDSAENIFVTGDFHSGDFDPGPGVAHFNSIGSADMYFARYDSSGNYVYMKQIGQAGQSNYASGYDMQISKTGNLVISGSLSATAADFDPGSGVHTLSSGGKFATSNFIAGYTKAGNYLFASASYSISGLALPSKLALDKNDNIYVTGLYHGTVDFDPGPDSTVSAGQNGYDEMFFEKYDANGNYLFAKFIYGNENNGVYNDVTATSIYVDDYNYIYTTGLFFGRIDFDPGSGTKLIGMPKENGYTPSSVFLAKYDSAGNYNSAYAFEDIQISGQAGSGSDVFVNNFGEIILAGASPDTINFSVGKDSVIFAPYKNAIRYYTYDFFLMQYLQLDFCAIADSLYTTNITSNSALLHWRYPHNSQGFTIQYRPVNTNTWQSTTSAGRTLSKKLNNLQANTNYEWRITALCNNDTSIVSDKSYFTTTAAAAFAIAQDDLSNAVNAPLTIYPNPSKGRFTVSIKSGTIGSFKIINSTGNVVYSNTNLTHNSVNVNIGHAASGIYLLSVSDGSKTFNKKLIIEK